MQLGMIGLGRLGGDMVRRLSHSGHAWVGGADPATAPFGRFDCRREGGYANQPPSAPNCPFGGRCEQKE
jgi:hypothetical protein